MTGDLDIHQSRLNVFEVEGAQMRFGQDTRGRPYVVAADAARRLEYASTQKALQVVDDDEKGLTAVVTPGGIQQMWVVYEDGIWELIFRSGKPEAKAIKKRVKAILREIGETGGYQSRFVVPKSLPEALRAYANEVEAHESTRATLAIAAPKADAWEVLASAEGDYSVREAAYILNRDPNISTGQNRLFDLMKEWRVIDRWKRPYQKHDKHVVLRTIHYRKPGDEADRSDRQVRVTIEGLRYLHKRMGGTAPISTLLGGPAGTSAIETTAPALFELEAA